MTPSEAKKLLPEEFCDVPDETIQDLIDLISSVCRYVLHTNVLGEQESINDTE